MVRVLEDSKRNPGAFCWFGAIPVAELKAWATDNGNTLPADLLQFWQETGGGDLFESETILRPDVPSRPNSCFRADDVGAANAAHKANGMPDCLFVFQTGAFLSAIDLHTLEYVTLNEIEGYAPTARFKSFDEWYLQTLRAEFADRYGLPPYSATLDKVR